MKKRLLSLLLALTLVLSLSIPAYAADVTASGTSDDGLSWSLSSDGVLTISGKGAMKNYQNWVDTPWFNYSGSFSSVVIKNGVTHIGSRAFMYFSFTEVTIADSVTSIGTAAFFNNNSLKHVTIPSSVTRMEDTSFAYCYRLTAINVASGNTDYSSADGVLFNKDKTKLIQYPNGKADSSYTIPASVTTIASENLESFENLSAFNVASGSKSFAAVDGVLFNKDKTELIKYPGAKSESSYAIPSGVTSIGDDAFSCRKLTKVTIPSSVTSIGNYAFHGCGKLTSITINNPDCDIYDEANTLGVPGITTVSGYKGSTAETYAKKYGYTFKVLGAAEPTLATPKITSVTSSGKAVTVKWGKVDGAAAYRLFYMKDGKWTKLKDTTGTSYTANGTYGKTYTYTVRCISADGKSYTSSYDAKGVSFTLTNGQLATPKITSVTASGKAVTVKWGKVDGAAAYRLFYMKNGKWTKLKDTTGTSYTANGTYGKTYTYTVRCISADGKSYTSGYDAKGVSITLTNGQLATPKITSVTASGKAVTVKWGAVDGAAAYRLFYMKDGKWVKLKDTTGTSVTLNGTYGKTYTYTVRCISADGKSYTSSYDAKGVSITLKK